MGWCSFPDESRQSSPHQAVNSNSSFSSALSLSPCVLWDFTKLNELKMLNSSAEIRVQFRHVPGNLFKRNFGTDLDKATNELVLRLQPDEAIYLKINNKVPGLGMRLDRSDLNLLFRSK